MEMNPPTPAKKKKKSLLWENSTQGNETQIENVHVRNGKLRGAARPVPTTLPTTLRAPGRLVTCLPSTGV